MYADLLAAKAAFEVAVKRPARRVHPARHKARVVEKSIRDDG
jgi:hypothetical protein